MNLPAASSAPKPTKTINLVIQSKGGIGKTFVSTLLAQFYQEAGQPVACFDIDPLNATFTAFKGLGVQHVKILDGNALEVAATDAMMMTVITGDRSSVIDCGSSGFVLFTDYLLRSGIPALAESMACKLIVHVILAGGDNVEDTVNGFLSVLDSYPPSAMLMIWINEHLGPVVLAGKPITETAGIFVEHKARIAGFVHLRKLDPRLEGAALQTMMTARLTFAEARGSGQMDIIALSRLGRVRDEIFGQMRDVPLWT